MSEKKSKNHKREKLTVLIDKDIKKEMKKEVLDLDCSMGEFLEYLFTTYIKNKK